MNTYLAIALVLLGLYLIGMGIMGYYNDAKKKTS